MKSGRGGKVSERDRWRGMRGRDGERKGVRQQRERWRKNDERRET